MDDQHKLIRRLFTRAAEEVGSAAQLAMRIAIPYGELRLYLRGEAVPPDEVLVRAVELILEDLPGMRHDTPAATWDSLNLPK